MANRDGADRRLESLWEGEYAFELDCAGVEGYALLSNALAEAVAGAFGDRVRAPAKAGKNAAELGQRVTLAERVTELAPQLKRALSVCKKLSSPGCRTRARMTAAV